MKMNVLFEASFIFILLIVVEMTHGSDGNKCDNGKYQTMGIDQGKPKMGSLKIYPNDVEVDDNVFIQCNVSSNPAAEIWWKFKYFRDDVKRSFGFSNCNTTLEIRHAVNWHTGLYQCVARNQYGTVYSPETPLRVKIKDESFYTNKAVIKKERACVSLKDNVTLSCQSNSSEGICSWYKNEEVFVGEQVGCEKQCCLNIRNMKKSDEGIYYCYMFYDLVKATFNLTINSNSCSPNQHIKSPRNHGGSLYLTETWLYSILLNTIVPLL